MSISKDIAPLLPYLRRFSRALNGSQAKGDAYVMATLESLLRDRSSYMRGTFRRGRRSISSISA
jgi:DNA-directed RNA polymerase specialized sigma24 family protein